MNKKKAPFEISPEKMTSNVARIRRTEYVDPRLRKATVILRDLLGSFRLPARTQPAK
mgnify:CR=1 FL=1